MDVLPRLSTLQSWNTFRHPQLGSITSWQKIGKKLSGLLVPAQYTKEEIAYKDKQLIFDKYAFEIAIAIATAARE